MGTRSRRKGASWEREVCRLLREHGIEAERRLDECRGGNLGDVIAAPRRSPDLADACTIARAAAGGVMGPSIRTFSVQA